MTDDQLRADRDRLAESLRQLRERLIIAARDQNRPSSVSRLVACLFYGHSIQWALQSPAMQSPSQEDDPEESQECKDYGGKATPRCTVCGILAQFVDGRCGLCWEAPTMSEDQLRANRDLLADSLFAMRHGIATVIRDPATPDPERRRLVSLLSGVEMRDAIEEGFQRQDSVGQHQDAEAGGEADQAGGGNRTGEGGEEAAEVTIHYDPATRWLREAGVTGPIDEVVMTWGKPVVFRDDQETND